MTGCLVLLYGQRWLQTLVRVHFDDASDFNVDWYATGELAQPSGNSKISSLVSRTHLLTHLNPS